jgi:osmoprotectant transport system permease protein
MTRLMIVLPDRPMLPQQSGTLIAAYAVAVDRVLTLFQRLFLSWGPPTMPDRGQQAVVDRAASTFPEPVVQGGTF